ncbi:MAG: hypothetical protein R2856_28935 [Caldilineaceae bacterium]
MADTLATTHPAGDAVRTSEEFIPRAVKTGYWRGENRLKTLIKRVIDVDQTLFPIHVQMAAWSVQPIIVDITERKQAEERIRHGQERYRQMFERVNPAQADHRSTDSGNSGCQPGRGSVLTDTHLKRCAP